ncbi:MAG: hypothetical protein NDI62_00875 [Burkholderiales bacterium]|nr:hypothetical protein [Burkholderiales bacterium]
MEYKSEIKNCQNCKKDFTIEPEDFKFYEKMKVPPPTWCPECRMIRRFSFQNSWNLYWRNCDLCTERTLSMYPQEDKIKVYCAKCYWSDKWDDLAYSMNYDSTRSFLEQIKELGQKTPYPALESLYTSLINSNYSNALAWSKNCYQVYWTDFCENVYYSSVLNGLKYSIDCLRGFESELCYESIGFSRCYNLFFSEECDDCLNVYFSRNCYGCTNCIGCVNLRGGSNCIFNVKYSKEEYELKLKELNLDSWKNIKEFKKEAYRFWLSKPYREYNGHSLNLNVTGDHVYTSKNSKDCYIVNGAENCKYCQIITVAPAKDCMDYSGWGNNAELIYEANQIGENASNVKFSMISSSELFNSEYCIWNSVCKNNFGCVNLKRKQYCILNKQYTKEEYEKLKEKIIEDMKKNPYIDKLGRKYYYGEFFPIEFSKFPYNKSNAMRFFPKTKEEALREGYSWSDKEDTFHESSFGADFLPEKIIDTDESILGKIIECEKCKNGFKIVKGELDLLHKINLPVPHLCPKCRENERFERMTKPKMYNRKCMKCNIDIYTPYSPDRPEIVYCVKCYQQEFV